MVEPWNKQPPRHQPDELKPLVFWGIAELLLCGEVPCLNFLKKYSNKWTLRCERLSEDGTGFFPIALSLAQVVLRQVETMAQIMSPTRAPSSYGFPIVVCWDLQ